MSMSGSRRVVIAAILTLHAVAHAGPSAPCPRAAAPADTGARSRSGGDVAALFDLLRLDRLERLQATFSEEKHIALLARPLRQSGTIYFDRTRGIARLTRTPRPERMLLTERSLRIERAGKIEDIPLDKSKALKAFALVFPALLRGERAELEAAFALELRGAPAKAWSLALTPRDPGLCGLISRVVVSGQGAEVSSLQVVEASGDTTDTRLSGIARNAAVPAAEVARVFGGR
jgi:hypothetical protein